MKKILVVILIIFYNTACSLDKVVRHHGVHFLENKQKKLNWKPNIPFDYGLRKTIRTYYEKN